MRESQALDTRRNQAKVRAMELKKDALSYIQTASQIKTGKSVHAQTLERKAKILTRLGANEENWQDWKWQIRNRICNATLLGKIIGLSGPEINKIEEIGKLYRWSISPYYASLIEEDYWCSPIFRQSVPDVRELESTGVADPMNEEFTSPAPRITRRYPDRLIINVTNQCAMFCRHCQRRRNIGETDTNASREELTQAIAYIADNPEIRDVLITGGDALMLSDQTLEWLLTELSNIPHVEIKRIGTRVPVTLPQRITPKLCNILKSFPPLFLNTQFNHPLEITPEAEEACSRLALAGVVMGNQAVLLRGINDSPQVMRKLNHELLRIRVRPYYIFQAKDVIGTTHWQTSIKKGMEIMDSLRGHTSGLAVPTFIVNAPGGLGKIPLMPNHILYAGKDRYYLRTWEGKTVEIAEKQMS